MFPSIELFILYGLSLGLILFAILCILLKLISTPHPVIKRAAEETCFFDPKSNSQVSFPSIKEAPTKRLSVIVPAFDEEKRLPSMLEECLEYLTTRSKENKSFTFEVIVVSDGSRDRTVQVALRYVKQLGTDVVRVLDLKRNRGKGGAVRLGIENARGALVLFADADGATKFSDYSKLESCMNELLEGDYILEPTLHNKSAIVIGSRSHLEDEAVATRTFIRTVLMYGFHFLVWLFAVRGLRDTQCGFKLLTRKAAQVCFASMHVERWAFDVELLYIAQTLRIPIREIAVNWTEIDGSKVTPFWSWLQMGRDLGLIWLRYRIGAWKIKNDIKLE